MYICVCTLHLMSDTAPVGLDPVCSKSDLFIFFAAILLHLAFWSQALPVFLVKKSLTENTECM